MYNNEGLNHHYQSSEVVKETPEEKIRRIISVSDLTIESDFLTTADTWLCCFGKQVVKIKEALVPAEQAQEKLGKDKFEQINNRIDTIVERFKILRKKYPQKPNVPPGEIRQELLGALNNILAILNSGEQEKEICTTLP